MDNRRFLLAMLLSGLVIFVWQIFFIPPPEDLEVDEEDAVVEEEIDPDEEPDPDEVAEPDEPEEIDPDDVVDAEDIEAEEVEVADIDERHDRISTGYVDVTLSNRGAVVIDASVTAPQQYARGTGGDMMAAFEEDAPDWPFSMHFLDGNIELPDGAMFEVIEEESELADDGETYDQITYRYTDPAGLFELDKVYSIAEARYTISLDVEIRNTLDEGAASLVGTPSLSIIGRDDPEKETSFFDFRPDVLEGVCHTTDDTERERFDGLDVREEFSQYTVLWAGADTRYFMMSAVPIDGADRCSFDAAADDSDYLRTRIYHPSVTLTPGADWSTSYTLYMGPKDFDVLRAAGHGLENAVDYGLFSFLARPLRWSLARLHGFTHNWGLAIILLTLIIKILTWRITGKAYTNAERMKQIQPQIKEIREKYENDQQRMTEETMKAFRENDVSPLGCLPLLLQMPILYGLFVMIMNSVELYQANFLWYSDLSAPDPWFILPIVMGAVMFVQQRITMATAASTNPQMMIVMKVMPVAFTAFMLFLPAGLVLYYLLNLLMGLSQQFLIKRKFRLAEEAVEEV